MRARYETPPWFATSPLLRVEVLSVARAVLSERGVREGFERAVRLRERLGPARLVFELREEPRRNLLLLGRRQLRDFREGLFEKCGHNFPA